MPLIKSCSRKALEANIQFLIALEGLDPDQAFAVANSVLRKACANEGRPMPEGEGSD